MVRRTGSVLVLAAALSLLTACAAMGATRYAAPGGTGADPCASPAAPCNVYTAADQEAPGTTIEAGDVVELAPGTYSEAAGDLGADDNVTPPAGVVVRGEPGKPRPLIVLQTNEGFWGAFFVGTAAEVADVEIRNQATSGSAITILDGNVERVVARSTVSPSFTCNMAEGTMRSSACINSAGGVAIGVSTSTFAGVHASIIRNSTFIATGPGSVGMDFAYFASSPGVIGAVNAIGVIAKGAAKDVIARGLELSGGHGATTAIELQASDYATTDTKTAGTGTASVTEPGTNGNITAPPLLAADNVHQLPGSPTIDKGAVDGASASLDVDEQAREIGLAPDIGADELGNPTSTTVKCSPTQFVSGGQSTCEVIVEDLGVVLTPPTGTVSFGLVPGLFVTEACTLTPQNEAASTCSATVSWLSAPPGPYEYKGTYGGDDRHEASSGSATITVLPFPSGQAGGAQPGLAADPPPVTQLKKHPPKRTTKQMAKFTFSANEAGARFECKLDRKPFRACSSPFKKKVKVGSHTFKVRAVDALGQADQTPAVFRWKVVAAG
jgi:hypothetical protein